MKKLLLLLALLYATQVDGQVLKKTYNKLFLFLEVIKINSL